MVGKPNFPPDVDERDDLRGAAAGTPGLTPLDEEREASLADEGGVSGARIEGRLADPLAADDDCTTIVLEDVNIEPRGPVLSRRSIAVIGSIAVAVAAWLAYRRWI